jgi:hypothetical protein
MRSTQSSPKLDELRLAVPFPTFFDVSAGEVAEKLAPHELGQRRGKFVVQFRDLEFGDIQLDADACPQAP